MASELPPQLQDQLQQLQGLQQQLQLAQQQRLQLELQVQEAERALGELEQLSEDAPIYRSLGSLLIKTEGKAAVTKKLTDEKESLQVRLTSIQKQEGRLKEKVTELQSKLQAAIKNLSGFAQGGGAKKSSK